MIDLQLQDEAGQSLPAIIVSGNTASGRRLEAAIKDHPRVTVECRVRTVGEAIERAETQRSRVVFLDLTATDDSSLIAARRLASGRALVIVSDRPDFAFEAFECGAIDYLLKPVKEDRLRATLQRIEQLFVSGERRSAAGRTDATPGRLSVGDRLSIPSRHASHGATTDLVAVSDVIWIESLQNYTIVQLSGRDRRTIKRPLTEWEALLPQREFVRIGRSHLVQLAKLRTITSPSRDICLAHFHGVEQPLQLGRTPAVKLKRFVRVSCPA